jgi:DNA-binding LacI/PurR family transcriptional regulator
VVAQRPTIADVARHAGVSKGAVSFAMNGHGGVSNETRDRILTAARELGWQPSHRARSLSVSRAFAFGLVLARRPELLGADPFFPSFIAGVETMLAPAGYALVLQVVPDEAAEEAGYRKLAGEGRVDGVFVIDLRSKDSRIGLLSELKLPAVTMNRPDVTSPFPAVCMDDQLGIGQAIKHLAELGHTRIAHVSGPLQFLHSRSRRDAWAAGLKRAGLARGPLLVSDFTAAGGSKETARLLDLADPPTAIVYANDVMAIAGVGVAHNRGLRVPRDLSVVGFDGTEIASHLHPPLTTITTNPFGWGQAAATLLLSVVGRVDAQTVADVDLAPGRLEIRDSTGRPLRQRRAPAPPRRQTTAAHAKTPIRQGEVMK